MNREKDGRQNMDNGRTPIPNPPSAAGNLNAQYPIPNSPYPIPNTTGASTRIQRTTLTGEIIEVETTAPQTAPPGSPGMFGANGLPNAPYQPSTTSHQSPIVSPYTAMNVAGVPYSALAPSMLREQGGMSHVPTAEKWELFLAIAAPILLLSAWIVHVAPHLIMWVGFIDLFVLSLAMGGTGAVPSYDDSYLDVGVMLVVTFMFGPILALAAYLILSMARQECNTAIVGLLILQIVVFQGMTLAFASNTQAYKNAGFFMMFGIMQFVSIFVAFLGWLLSSFLRPVGE